MYNNAVRQRVLAARLALRMEKMSKWDDTIVKTENGYAELDANGKPIFKIELEAKK